MTNDDTKTRKAGRRTALALMAGAALALRGIRARAQPRAGCVVRPEQTEGPYFIDTGLERSDIRADPASGEVEPGVPLALTMRVSRLQGARCEPLPGAQVELWQCNARGVYSGVRDRHSDATGRKFLRGYQVSDADGSVRFTTIYPGWYPGRTVHIHFMIRTPARALRRDEFTSQLYFDDALTDRIFAQPPYAGRGPRSVRNGADGIYRRGGSQLMLAVAEDAGGLRATFDIALEGGR